MEYSVEEIPAASWAPNIEPALACYRIVHEVAGTLLETPDATERDERNAREFVAILNSHGALLQALRDIHDAATSNAPFWMRVAEIEWWASQAITEATKKQEEAQQ
jgi:hypothetical protein